MKLFWFEVWYSNKRGWGAICGSYALLEISQFSEIKTLQKRLYKEIMIANLKDRVRERLNAKKAQGKDRGLC